MPRLWILIGLLSFASLQATNNSMDSLEAHHNKQQLGIDKLVLDEPAFAFVYNSYGTQFRYKIESPVVFQAKGAIANFAYNSTTGELTAHAAGTYEVVYGINPQNKSITNLALAVNGKEVPASVVPVRYQLMSATCLLTLDRGDRVTLILPHAKTPTFIEKSAFGRLPKLAHSVSLFINKI
jgi:hypothetical protein